MNSLSRFVSSTLTFASLLIPLALLLVFLNTTPEFNHLGPDTFEYLAFTDEILTGNLFTPRPIDEIPIGSIIRTPGFPAVLAMGRLFSPDDLRIAMLVGHSIVFSVAFILLSVLARSYASPSVFGILLFPALFQMQPVFAGLASEWSAFCFLLMLISCLLGFFKAPTPRRLLLLGLVASLVTLSRPALCITATVPFAALLLLPTTSWPRRILLAFFSLTLMWSWMGFNWYRLGSFSLAPRGGANIFCVGALVGKASVYPTDSQELRKFIEDLNRETVSVSPTEMAEERTLDISPAFFSKYVGNYPIADNIAARSGINRVTENEYLGIFGLRSIRENAPTYLLHLYYGAQNFALTGYLLLPAFFLPIVWIRKSKHVGLSWSVLAMFYVHVCHLSLVLLTQPLLSRYYSVTFYPLLMMSLLVVFQVARDCYHGGSSSGEHLPSIGR
jgi:hypothetical protein